MTRMRRRSGIVAVVSVCGVAGAAVGTLTARDAASQLKCEQDQCGPYGAICITSSQKTACDAIDGGNCRTLDCTGIKKP